MGEKIQKKGENNVDLSIQKLRILQQMVYSFDVSDNDLFKYINEIITTMELASNEIRMNYEDISKGLTDLMNGKANKRNSKKNEE